MNYLEWAPLILVEWHKSQLDGNSTKDKFNKGFTPNEMLNYKIMTEARIEDYQRYILRISLGYFNEESTALLGKLMTDTRMNDVWKTLSKRIDKESDFYFFFFVCEDGISGWKSDLKQTVAERKVFYQEIQVAAGKLLNLMDKSEKFDLYSIAQLIDKERIEWLRNTLEAPKDLSFTKAAVTGIMPEIYKVLIDISETAARCGDEELFVKKPNSEKADIHYFARMLSQYLKDKYKQPLHEVVATTAEVVFDRKYIDSDYIRKLVG